MDEIKLTGSQEASNLDPPSVGSPKTIVFATSRSGSPAISLASDVLSIALEDTDIIETDEFNTTLSENSMSSKRVNRYLNHGQIVSKSSFEMLRNRTVSFQEKAAMETADLATRTIWQV